jgi:leucyl/phenylalanyl-tRNA--protein transferase
MSNTLPPSQYLFPNPLDVDPDGDGLIATGGDLAPSTILAAYKQGLFPWFSADDPICWWSPEPRCIIEPQHFEPSKSLKRQLKKNQYQITLSQSFTEVITACAGTRPYADSTWISQEIIAGYSGLHQAGLAHSVEVWDGDVLVGGLYGVQLGGAFFGESMFSHRTDVSKMAFYFLMRLCAASSFRWIDCQLPNEHLMSLGAITKPRAEFLHELSQVLKLSPPDWQLVRQQRFSCLDLLTDALFSGLINSDGIAARHKMA